MNIIQVARDKAALGVGRETVAKEDVRMDKDMLGGWGRHTNQVCFLLKVSDNALIFVPGLLPTSFVGSSLFSLCQCWRLCPWPRHLQVNFGYAGNIKNMKIFASQAYGCKKIRTCGACPSQAGQVSGDFEYYLVLKISNI